MSIEDGDDPSCYMVQETTFDYEYDEGFDWENVTAAQCNCTHPLHKFLEVRIWAELKVAEGRIHCPVPYSVQTK